MVNQNAWRPQLQSNQESVKNCQAMQQKISFPHEKTQINQFSTETFPNESQFSLY